MWLAQLYRFMGYVSCALLSSASEAVELVEDDAE